MNDNKLRMNYNASLDEIIKRNKSKIDTKSKKPWNNKSAKPAFNLNTKKKSNPPIFKSKFRKRKAIGIPDARMKIIQNKKRARSKSKESRSPLLQDARLKIEAARRQKNTVGILRKPSYRSKNGAITSLAANGLIQRRINSRLGNDNGIRVEYEDEEMSLENETVPYQTDWPDKFTIRRTVDNVQERRRLPPTLMGYRDLDADPEYSMYYDSKDNLPLNEVTRTFTNIKTSPLRKNYSSRISPPLRQSSCEDMRDLSVPKPSLSSRESSYHRIMISNLHENVTGEDIKELFEDVGDLVYAKMIRNGMAEVAYKEEKDAMDAVEIYHNRQLDGLPMKCTLLNNHEYNVKKRHTRIPPVSTHSSIEPDAHIIKKALFSG